MELDAISQPELDQIAQIGRADLVIGIFNPEGKGDSGSDVAMTREALAELAEPLRAMVICNNGTHDPAAAGIEVNHDSQSPEISTYSLPLPGPAETPQQSISSVYRKVFTVGGKLGARACSVIVSQPQAVTHHWIFRLVQPVMNLGFDLVTPCYARQKMEGLLTRSILSPLQRALYGEQIQNPMGPDFGLSGKLLQRVLTQEAAGRRGPEVNALAGLFPLRPRGGFSFKSAKRIWASALSGLQIGGISAPFWRKFLDLYFSTWKGVPLSGKEFGAHGRYPNSANRRLRPPKPEVWMYIL